MYVCVTVIILCVNHGIGITEVYFDQLWHIFSQLPASYSVHEMNSICSVIFAMKSLSAVVAAYQ